MGKQGELDKSSLELLEAALARLQNGCQLDSKDLWLGKTPEQLRRVTPGSGIEETATSLLDTIERLKRVNRLLDALSNSSKDFISTLQKGAQPVIFHHGLMSLPAEILVRIYEYIKDNYDPVLPRDEDENYPRGKYNRFNKYNVCRRIRNIAISSPTLWTTLHSEMDRVEFEVYLERSKNADLSIILRSPLPQENFSKFLTDVLRSPERLKEVTIESRANSSGSWKMFNSELRDFPELRNLRLPALTSLTVRSKGSRSSESLTISDPENSEGSKDVFSRWEMPNLRRLNLYSTIPGRMQYGRVITSLTANFREMDVELGHFVSFLKTLPNLREFTLEGVISTDTPQPTNDQHASFPHLTTLTLRMCDDQTLRLVLQSFDMPKVSKFILHMNISGYATNHLTFPPILYEHSAFIAHIKTFELTLDSSMAGIHPDGMLDHLLNNFKSLEHLSFSTAPTRPYLPTDKMFERLMFFKTGKLGLKTIRVSDCSDLSATLPRIMHYLAHKKKSEPDSTQSSGDEMEVEKAKFERLEIVGRTNFIEEDFSFVSKGKVVWSP